MLRPCRYAPFPEWRCTRSTNMRPVFVKNSRKSCRCALKRCSTKSDLSSSSADCARLHATQPLAYRVPAGCTRGKLLVRLMEPKCVMVTTAGSFE